MTTTISRLYDSHAEARAAVRDLEAAGVSHGEISIIASNADNWYDTENKTYPDRDLDGRDDRAEGAATGGGIGALAGGAAYGISKAQGADGTRQCSRDARAFSQRQAAVTKRRISVAR